MSLGFTPIGGSAIGADALAGIAAIEAEITSEAPISEALITVAVEVVISSFETEAPVSQSLIRVSAQYTRVFSEVDLNDRNTYYYGYKAPYVLQFLGARRGVSDRNGQLEHLQFGAILTDTETPAIFRGFLASSQNKYLINRPLTQRMITDPARRREETPRIVANGYVAEPITLPNRQFKIIGQDWLKKKLDRYSSTKGSTWQPRIRPEDFPLAEDNIGHILPIIYGRITDTYLTAPFGPTDDSGDGQFPVLFGGDRVINGVSYRIGIIAAHHCDYLEAAFWPGAPDGVDLEGDPDWLTPRNAAAWAAAGFTKPYQTINGRDYFVIYVKGDAGATLPDPIDEAGGNTSVTVNVWGRTDTGDETGTLITNGFDQYVDFMRNYVCSDSSWVSGPPLPIPQFPTVPLPFLDAESFEQCKEDAEERLPCGYTLDFAIGAKNTSWTLQDSIAEFNKNLDCEGYINHYGAYAVTMEPPALRNVKPALTDIIDILESGLTITDKIRDFWNIVPFRHTFDYVGRMQSERSSAWRSEMSGDLERRHELSIVKYEQERSSQVYEFAFIRGKNRSTDSDWYLQGSAVAADIATRLVSRYANPRRHVTITVPLNGLMYDIGDIVPISAQDGVGVQGWVGRHIRITGHEVLASKGQVILDGYDFDAVLEAQDEDLEE